jgi:hypothetical protein
MRREHGRRLVTSSGPTGDGLGRLLPGPAGGPPSVTQVDQVLDLVADLTASTQSWSAAAWAKVVRGSVRGTAEGPRCLARVADCLVATGRVELLRYAERALQDGLPRQAGSAGRLALTDALAAVVVSDVLPTGDYLALTRALFTATA